MVAAVQLKMYVADVGIFRIIIDEFSYWKKPYSVVLLKVNKGMEISFHCAVLSFGLAVSLGFKGCKKSLFGSEKVTKQ